MPEKTPARGALTAVIAAAGGVCVVAGLFLAFRLLTGPHPAPRAPLCLVIGSDNSRSNRTQAGAGALSAARLGSELASSDTLTLVRVNATAEEYFAGPPPVSRTQTLEIILNALKDAPPRKGTFPLLFWRDVAERCAQADAPVFAVFYTDGENDDQSAQTRSALRKVIRELAADKHLRFVALVGAKPQTRAGLRRDFAPLKRRFDIFAPGTISVERLVRLSGNR